MSRQNLLSLFFIFLSVGIANASRSEAESRLRETDANIIAELRHQKARKISHFAAECNAIERRIADYQLGRIVPDNQKSKRKSVRVTFPTREAKREAITDLKLRLVNLQRDIEFAEANNIALLISPFQTPFYIGQFGSFGLLCDTLFEGYQYFRILTIIDENNALAEFIISVTYISPRGPRESQHLVGIPGPPVYRHSKTEIVWLRGIKTAGLVNGSKVSPPLYMIITGTQDYHTPIGSKETVFVFEPLEIPENF